MIPFKDVLDLYVFNSPILISCNFHAVFLLVLISLECSIDRQREVFVELVYKKKGECI